MRSMWRYLWPLPLTLLGLALALLARLSGGTWAIRGGVVEACGPAARMMLRLHPVGGVTAMALGHVVIARDSSCLAQSRAHEREHVRQFERWGLLFPVVYVGESAYCWISGQDPYLANRFERAAEAAARTDTTDTQN
ncbi:MAG: signal peptide prediction [Burkholderiales bacterium]